MAESHSANLRPATEAKCPTSKKRRYNRIPKRLSTTLVAVACSLGTTVAQAGSGVTIEAVNIYNPSCGLPNLNNSIENVYGFRDKMLSVPGFTSGLRYTNSNVWRQDFIESTDATYFDRSTNLHAIGYFDAHGLCNDFGGACTTSSNCNSPPVGMALPGRCLRNAETPVLSGVCVYNRLRVSVTGYCDAVNYSTGVRWGESPQAGTFAAAGMDGGINFVVIDNSCGIRPNLYTQQLARTFAGVSTIALVMPTRAEDDTLNVATRGVQFATRYTNNPSSSIAFSWTDTINSVTDGGACPFGGGGHGIDGCGAYIAVSADSTPERAAWSRDTENWIQVRDDANDSTGNVHYAWRLSCNYNCNAHPFELL